MDAALILRFWLFKGLKTGVFNFTIGGAFYITRGDRLLLIVGMFTTAKGNFHFHKRALEIHFQRYKRIALTVDFACNFCDFALMQQ